MYEDELARQVEGPDLSTFPCPSCQTVGSLHLDLREIRVARPLGTFSLSGVQTKLSVFSQLVPHIVCRSDGCDFVKTPKLP